MKATWPKLTIPELPENDWIESTRMSATKKLTTTRRSAGLATAFATSAMAISGTASRVVPRTLVRRAGFTSRVCGRGFLLSTRTASALLRPRQQALGPEVQDRDHDQQREGIAERRDVDRQRRVERHLDERQHEAADDGARERAQPSDHTGDEGLEHRVEAHRRLDGAKSREDEDSGDARQR